MWVWASHRPGITVAPGHVDDPRRRGVDRRPAVEHAGDAVALDQDVAVEGPLGGVARARHDPGVGDQRAVGSGAHVIAPPAARG